MKYGIKLKYIRTAELWTQEKIATVLEINRSTYKEYETQNAIIPLQHLVKFCEIFNISIDYVFDFTETKNYNNNKSEIDKQETGKRLKDFRKVNKLTQEKLAKLLNTTQSVIADYERGRYLISTANLYTICRKYKISADYLLGKIDKPQDIS